MNFRVFVLFLSSFVFKDTIFTILIYNKFLLIKLILFKARTNPIWINRNMVVYEYSLCLAYHTNTYCNQRFGFTQPSATNNNNYIENINKNENMNSNQNGQQELAQNTDKQSRQLRNVFNSKQISKNKKAFLQQRNYLNNVLFK